MTDPHFSSVVSLLHFEGTDGSQAFTDSSNSANTWTARASGDQIDDAQSKFGNTSLVVSEGVSVGNVPDFDFGMGDFTWECWHRPTSIPEYAYIFANASSRGDVGCLVEYGTGRNGGWIVSIQNSPGTIGGAPVIGTTTQGVGSNPTAGVWQHIALTRASGVLRLFLDGVEIGSDGGVASAETFSNDFEFAVGDVADLSFDSFPVNGHVDEIRITKGVARYTSNFTPPTEAFPDTGTDPGQVMSQFAHGQCRLTLDGADLKLSRYNGKWLIIDGDAAEVPANGVTLSPAGLSSNTTYYIYAALSGGSMILEASTTGHAIDSESGVEIKSGDSSRTLVGMARTNGSAAFVDSAEQVFVVSWFNRLQKLGRRFDPTAYQLSTSTWTEASTALRVEFICWEGQAKAQVQCRMNSSSSNGAGEVAVGVDGTTNRGNSQNFFGIPTSNNIQIGVTSSSFDSAHYTEGYHFATVLFLRTNIIITVGKGETQVEIWG